MNKVLIVVDMQGDFINGNLGTPEAVSIVDKVATRIANSKEELILFTQDTHESDYLQTPEGKKLPVIHCLNGTTGWQINEKVKEAWRQNNNTIILPNLKENTFIKQVFGSVALVDFLKQHENNIKEIEIVGICTDICVISNAIMIKNYLPQAKIAVNKNLCAGVSPDTHLKALEIMSICHIDII